ncbi:hypothetical protein BDN72DRAFT_646710 [Pluteus cervinus]|uniref:Uncharacterized protein n=1 Tax=Pluteus cervinus TaxID=181527 RepID=A0ACD3ASX5_9AGAR|nr:hypothetical protein BDN72DRAFT_646710 [Pluteus cervinus]
MQTSSFASKLNMASPLSHTLLQSSSLVAQGAEARVYKSSLTIGGPPFLLKHRFNKQYRHPSLDASLTRSRVAGEARALLKCLRSGVNVPGVRFVDASEGILGIEWIDGLSVRRLLPGGTEDEEDLDGESIHDPQAKLSAHGISVGNLMSLIGIELAKMHAADIIHGDLTTSNMMLRHLTKFQVPVGSSDSLQLVLIDFGLSYHSALVEDKAVDLYVLERAFASTHPESEPLFASVLQAYADRLGKEWSGVKRRLDDVRLRGRKRSMVG